jgi:hypothetical protein
MEGIFVSTVDDLVRSLEGKLDQDLEVIFMPRYPGQTMRERADMGITKVYTRGGRVVIEVEPK